MNARLLAVALLGAAFALGVLALLVTAPAGADSSTLSRSGSGWLAARKYLEARGCRVALLDRGLEAGAAPGGVLVLGFPWQSDEDRDGWQAALDRQLRSGGTLVFAYSGNLFELSEQRVAELLELGWDERRGRVPLHPLRWREFAAEEWALVGEPAAKGRLRPGRVTALRRVPRAPERASVLARDAVGRPLAFSVPRQRGLVVVLPAEALSNARLAQPGNADLLETLRVGLGDVWAFDEFHHGLRPPLTPGDVGAQRVLLLFLAQLVFVYVLVALAIARRFGPAWHEGVPTSGSAAGFLVGLGSLHQRLGHEREAAPLLLLRARALDGRLVLPSVPEAERRDLLRLARRVGEAQSGRLGVR